jgi:hypothetical protein
VGCSFTWDTRGPGRVVGVAESHPIWIGRWEMVERDPNACFGKYKVR